MAEEQIVENETPETTSPVVETNDDTTVETGENPVKTPTETDGTSVAAEKMVPLTEVQAERAKKRELEEALNNPELLEKRLSELRKPAPQEEPVDKMVEKFINPDGTFNLVEYTKFQNQQTAATRAEFQRALTMRDAEAAYPELKSDDEFARATVAYAEGYGITYSEAAAKVKSLMMRTAEKAKAEGAQQAKTQLTEKERAQTAGAGKAVESDETNDLRVKMSSSDPREAEKARLDYLKLQNKKMFGI